MNDDHAEALRLYATKLLGAPDGEWRCVGCDPGGLDLQLGRAGLRLPFPAARHQPAAALRCKILVDLARQSARRVARPTCPMVALAAALGQSP